MTDLNELAQERNRLANERTYLSWVRTSLAILGAGFVILKFIPYNLPEHIEEAKHVGLIVIFASITLLVFSLVNYIRSERPRSGGKGTVVAAILMTVVLVGAALWLLRIS